MNPTTRTYPAARVTLTVVEPGDGFPAVFTLRPTIGRAVEVFHEGAMMRRPGMPV